jgi:hypothetical protein
MESLMLTVLHGLPERLLSCEAPTLKSVLSSPTLIHLPGRREEPLFVSVLLHGNEDTGLKAVQSVLRRHAGQTLPRALSVFVGNLDAAEVGVRRLDAQPDYNRVWPGGGHGDTPEAAMMRAVVDDMRARRVFASVDIHNNTGLNPHYACVNRLDHRFFHLATLFSRIVVYFTRPAGVQSTAFAELCPAVTVECGKPGSSGAEEHAAAFVEAALSLASHPAHPVPRHDIELFHTVATVKVAEQLHFGFGAEAADLVFVADLDHMNFRELPAGTRIADLSPACHKPLVATDQDGRDVTSRYFDTRRGALLLARQAMPAMLTLDARVIVQDCLCYLMERLPVPER